MDIKRCDDDHLDIDFHYCPLVKAWQKQGCSDEEIQLLCDHAMCKAMPRGKIPKNILTRQQLYDIFTK